MARKKIKKQVGGVIPRVGGNLAGAASPLGGAGVASPLGGGALPGTRMIKKGGKVKARHGGVIPRVAGARTLIKKGGKAKKK